MPEYIPLEDSSYEYRTGNTDTATIKNIEKANLILNIIILFCLLGVAVPASVGAYKVYIVVNGSVIPKATQLYNQAEEVYYEIQPLIEKIIGISEKVQPLINEIDGLINNVSKGEEEFAQILNDVLPYIKDFEYLATEAKKCSPILNQFCGKNININDRSFSPTSIEGKGSYHRYHYRSRSRSGHV